MSDRISETTGLPWNWSGDLSAISGGNKSSMDWLGWSNFGAGVIGGIAGIFQNKRAMDMADEQFRYEQGINERNFQFQKDQFEYQKGQNELMRQREDNAVQRRVEDLKAAGLSPVLAAGSAAQTHQPVQTNTPQMEKASRESAIAARMNMANMYLNLVRQQADIAHTSAETDRVRDQIITQQQSRNLAFKDYQLREMGHGLDLRRVEVDEERVRQSARQLGISEGHLVNDTQRVANEAVRIEQESRRLLNEEQRTNIQRNALEITKLHNEVQQGLIKEQTYSERLRQLGIIYDVDLKNWELQMHVYDYALLSQLGLPTRTNLPQFQHLNWARGAAANNALEKAAENARSYQYSQANIEHNRLIDSARGSR